MPAFSDDLTITNEGMYFAVDHVLFYHTVFYVYDLLHNIIICSAIILWLQYVTKSNLIGSDLGIRDEVCKVLTGSKRCVT
jgi:hypothetical protein